MKNMVVYLPSTEEDKGCFTGKKSIWLKHGGEQLQMSNHELFVYFTNSVREKEVSDDIRNIGWSKTIE